MLEQLVGLVERIVTEVSSTVIPQFTWVSLVDILLVALIFYGLFRLFQGTQAVALLRGILVVALVFVLAASRFTAFGWVMRNTLPIILVAIPVIFQPELRRALEHLGRTAPAIVGRGGRETATQRAIHEIVLAVETLARERTGALLVLEGDTGLEEYIESGERVDAGISARLLLTIFFPGTPLHDGAVIIRGDRIVAAACVLPLTQRDLGDGSLGTRHRAAVGVTEQNDALVIIVSEETGIISLTRSGRIARRLDGQRLRTILQAFYRPRRLFGNGI
ncbi:MAG: DNA integrity scanning protein DisA [Chloroflexi bacterium ADurb.Bin325]|nr:MAG: DNA integrity scanning protein DisA [Chloroflexi bacterium ADurb.Bin325]